MKWKYGVGLMLVLCAAVLTAGAAEVTLNWQPGTAPAAEITDDYVLYYKPLRDGLYDGLRSVVVTIDNCVDNDGDGLHDDCTYVWANLPDGDRVHYFVATARNEVGESGYSNEARKVYTPAPPPKNLTKGGNPGQGN